MATETSAISQSASNGMRRQHTPKASQAKMSELNRSAAASVLSRNRLASFSASIRALAWAASTQKLLGAAHVWGGAGDHIGEALKAVKGFEAPISAWEEARHRAEILLSDKRLTVPTITAPDESLASQTCRFFRRCRPDRADIFKSRSLYRR